MRFLSILLCIIFPILGCTEDPSIPEKSQPILDYTNPVSSITPTTARSGGFLSSNGGHVIIERGICWSTSPSPTISNSKASSNGGVGSFSCDITSLISGNIYYVRAYVTTIDGTVYANQVSFNTLSMPSLITATISSITSSSAASGGSISNSGGSTITARGVCWSTNPNPTISLSTKTTNGTGTGAFISSLTGLTPGTSYFVRAYATNAIGTSYGGELSFTTKNVSSVSTNLVTSITNTTATCGGNVVSDGGSTVTTRGVCWNTTGAPTIFNTRTLNGSGTGVFTSTLSGLSAGITYYVRAYATNAIGTSYGGVISFTTQTIPTITTNAVTSITTTSAMSGGNVVSGGGATVTSRGICWSTSINPTILNSRTISGSGTGSFSSTMTGLITGTTYYVRAYATNSWGTAYGSNFSFRTN